MTLHDNNDTTTLSMYQQCIPPGPGCLDMLTKCATHPSVQICAMVLPIITPVLATEVGLATQWLPILQRRAIIPHHYQAKDMNDDDDDNDNETKPSPQVLSLVADDTSYVGYQDFIQHFRQTVLADALVACYNSHSDYYLASCTAAIEEFCAGTAQQNHKLRYI